MYTIVPSKVLYVHASMGPKAHISIPKRAIMLAVLTVIPNFIESTLNITGLNGLSTTSLLILAGVILDLIREIKNIYYSNVYSNMYR